jgi:DNA-binding NarL/FixJ family response regulator
MTLGKRDAGRKKIRVLIVDDHPMICDGIKSNMDLEKDMEVCGFVASAAETLPAIVRTRPDAVLLDISLPDGNGLDVLRDIVKACPDLPVVMFSIHASSWNVERALHLGAKGYVAKGEPASTIFQALRKASAGGIHVSLHANESGLKNLPAPGNEPHNTGTDLSMLSVTERELLSLIARGTSTKDIADGRRVTTQAVDKQRRKLMAKLGISTIQDLTRLAIKAGIVPP